MFYFNHQSIRSQVESFFSVVLADKVFVWVFLNGMLKEKTCASETHREKCAPSLPLKMLNWFSDKLKILFIEIIVHQMSCRSQKK